MRRRKGEKNRGRESRRGEGEGGIGGGKEREGM